MKKILPVVIALGLSFPALAATISQDEADKLYNDAYANAPENASHETADAAGRHAVLDANGDDQAQANQASADFDAANPAVEESGN